MIKKIITAILSVLIIYPNSFAQQNDSLKLSLKDAVQKTLEHNFGILLSQKDLEKAEQNDSWGKAGLYPLISAGAGQNNRYDNIESLYTNGRDESYKSSLTPYINIQMNLFKGFSVKITKENLEHLKSVSESKLRLTAENTLTQLINAYNAVLLENEKLKVTEYLMQLSKDRYKYELIRQKLGLSVSYKVLQEKNAFLTDSSNYLSQLMNTRSAMRELGKIMGDKEINDYMLTDSLRIKQTDFDLADLENKMYENNTDLKILLTDKQIKENNVKLAKSSLYPSLSLNAGADHTNSYLKYNSVSSTSYSYDAYAGLSLSYNIFNGNNRKRNINEAKIDAEKSQIQTEELKTVLRNNLYNLYEMYQTRKQLLKVAEENFKAASLNLEISKDKFRTGVINSFNFRDIQKVYLNSAFALSQAKYYLIMTYNDLLRISGQIYEAYQ